MPTHVQSVGLDAGTTAGASLAFASSTTPGTHLVVVARWNALAGGESCVVTDTLGNVYRSVDNIYDANGGASVQSFIAYNTIGGANTVTLTPPGSRASVRWGQLEYSGCDVEQPVESHGWNIIGTPTTATDAVSTGGMNASIDGCCVLGGLVMGGSTTTITDGTGFTRRLLVGVALTVEEMQLALAGPQPATWTVDITSNPARALGMILAPVRSQRTYDQQRQPAMSDHIGPF